MARGWESKSVESQRQDAALDQGAVKKKLSAEQREAERKRHGLLLSRTRILHDLDTSTSLRYRKNLQDALAFLDGELERLSGNH